MSKSSKSSKSKPKRPPQPQPPPGTLPLPPAAPSTVPPAPAVAIVGYFGPADLAPLIVPAKLEPQPSDKPQPLAYLPPALPDGLTLQHVEQREGFDCGLATAAMLGGLTYEQAEAFDPRPKPIPPKRGLWARELALLLERATGQRWRFSLRRKCPLRDLKLPGRKAAVLLRFSESESHWIAVEQASGIVVVFDPLELEPLPVADYYGRDYLTGKSVVPA